MKNRLDVKVSLFQNCKASGMPVREIFLCDFLSGSTFRAKYKTTGIGPLVTRTKTV